MRAKSSRAESGRLAGTRGCNCRQHVMLYQSSANWPQPVQGDGSVLIITSVRSIDFFFVHNHAECCFIN